MITCERRTNNHHQESPRLAVQWHFVLNLNRQSRRGLMAQLNPRKTQFLLLVYLKD